MDNDDEVKIPKFINLTKKKKSGLNIELSYDDFLDRCLLQMTDKSIFKNQKEYLLAKIGQIVFYIMITFFFISCIIFILPENLREDILKLLVNLIGLSRTKYLIKHLLESVLAGLFISFIIIAISSLKIPSKIFLKISDAGINIISDKPERGSIFIEKKNIKDIIVKENRIRSSIFYSIIVSFYNSVFLSDIKMFKKEIPLIPNIEDVPDGLFRKNEFKDSVKYIKKEIKKALKI